MNVRLMLPDRDFDPCIKYAGGTDAEKAGRALKGICSTMAQGDKTVLEVCTAAFFSPLSSAREIRYRQDALRDGLGGSAEVRELYRIVSLAMEKKRETWAWLSPTHYLTSNFSSAVRLLEIYSKALKQLRDYAARCVSRFHSEGFAALLSMLRTELSDGYFARVEALLNELKDGDSWLIGARLGNYNQGVGYVLCRRRRDHSQRRWRSAPSYKIAPNSNAESEDLEKRVDRTINNSANTLAQAAEQVERFFIQLKTELAFYIGCLNLYERLRCIRMPACIPELSGSSAEGPSRNGLYDVGLALIVRAAMQNGGAGEGLQNLYAASGDQRAGSTLLRSMGLAQLMMQCGMPAGAESLRLPVRDDVFAYFLRTASYESDDLKAHLMFRNADFSAGAAPCFGKDALISDLALAGILSAMAKGDPAVRKACESALFRPLQTLSEIRYRQDILRDCIGSPGTVRRLYDIAAEAVKRKRSSRPASPGELSASAVALLEDYAGTLLKLRDAAGKSTRDFRSEGFQRLVTMLWRELDSHYFAEIGSLLNELELKDRDGAFPGDRLGGCYQGRGDRAHSKQKVRFGRRIRAFFSEESDGSGDPDDRCARAVDEQALARSTEHIENFFAMLRGELAFYIGCLNLCDRLKALGMPVCIPAVLPQEAESRSCASLYDVGLALQKGAAVAGNALCAGNKRLTIITGANQGGKSTFLRSIGQSQLMMQCGMFVGAETCRAPIRKGIFTHFEKGEDAAMKSGRLDEELARMREVADRLAPGALMLFNESFAATNEREGSEICRQITKALIDNAVEVFSVTHLFIYAAAFQGPGNENVRFLRAQRLENGERTFKIVPGAPLPTAFGEDLYRKVFGPEVQREGHAPT